MTEEQKLAVLERENAKWLQRNGFDNYAGKEGQITYHMATGQRVNVKPANAARWRADLNARRDKALGKDFRFTLPTADTMAWAWSPAGRAHAKAEAQRKRLGALSLLGIASGVRVPFGYSISGQGIP